MAAAPVDAVTFWRIAHNLADAARAAGLKAPSGFRSAALGEKRSLRRSPDGVVVIVERAGRSATQITADIAAGILAANGRAGDTGLERLLVAAADQALRDAS